VLAIHCVGLGASCSWYQGRGWVAADQW
jgi:hypothetical protein